MINPNDFSSTVHSILDEYGSDVKKAVAQAVEKTGGKVLNTVKNKSPVRKGKDGGRYKKGWKKKVTHTGLMRMNSTVTIYNKTDASLVHLLEYGHQIAWYPDSPRRRATTGYQKVVGGRVEGIPHVRPAYEEAERLLPEAVEKAIEEATGG